MQQRQAEKGKPRQTSDAASAPQRVSKTSSPSHWAAPPTKISCAAPSRVTSRRSRFSTNDTAHRSFPTCIACSATSKTWSRSARKSSSAPFASPPTYRYPQKFSTWLFTITRNLAINQSRRRKRSPIRNITELNLEGIDMSGDPYQVAARATDERRKAGRNRPGAQGAGHACRPTRKK